MVAGGQSRALRRTAGCCHPCGGRRRNRGDRLDGCRGDRLRHRRSGRGLRTGHGELHAEAEPGGLIEIVGPGEFGHRDMVAARDAHQRIAAIDDMDARRLSRSGNRLAGRRRERRCGRCSHSGRPRNDQLLAGRQHARALVAVGLQDRGGRDVVALRQTLERVAGADDDRWRRCAQPDARPRPSAAAPWRWSRWASATAARRTKSRALLPTPARASRISVRCSDGWRRQGLGLELRRRTLRPGVLRRLAAFDGGRAHRTGRFGLRGEGIGERAIGKARLHIGAAAGKADRHQRQHRDLRHPTRAKQLGETGHGYSLVRNKILF